MSLQEMFPIIFNFNNKKPHLYTKGGEKQYKDYEKNSMSINII